MKQTLIALALAGGFAAGAQAGEVYTGIGTHGLMLGYAQALSPSFTVRGDFASAGSRTRQETDSGILYDAKLTYNRTGLFGDWFFAGGWRLTGGVTANNMKIDLQGIPQGNTITIGDTTYVTQPGDRFDAQVKFPSTTPYLGLGYGHHASDAGLGFIFDLGASIGRATVTAAASGPSFDSMSGAQRQQLNSDIDKETQQLRDSAGKVKAIPLLSLGINYRF